MTGLRPALWLLVVILAAGCALERDRGQPQLRYGEIMCAECGMLISDPRFAAAARTDTGEALGFDDIGCLLRHAWRQSAARWQLWVPAEPDGAWIDARTASYERRDGLATPMGYGFTAVRARGAGPGMSFAAAMQAASIAEPQLQGEHQ